MTGRSDRMGSDQERQLDEIAEQAAERAVAKFAIRIGLDPDNPLEAQKDMAFLHTTRKRCEGTGWRAWLIGVAIVVAGVLGLMWDGLKAKLGLG